MALVFFDIDKTLLSINSATEWVRREHRLGHMGSLELAQALMWLLQYRLGWSNLSDTIRRALELNAGASMKELRTRTAEFWAETVSDSFRADALQRLEEHRQSGDELALLSSTSNLLAELVAKELNITHVLCTHLEEEDGKLTGKALGPLCYGEGKGHYATVLSEQLSMPLSEATFYTDSISDLSALELVGNPVAICPDRALRKLAQQRGWMIEDWE